MTLPAAVSPIFKGLSGVAFLSLWGLMAADGTLVALLKTAWSGAFPDGTLLHTTYTGIVFIDFPISILVAFFYGLQNLPGTLAHLMLVDLVAVLLVTNMVTIVESQRPNTPKWLRSSLLWQYLWNCTGVALILPIYSLLHVKQRFEDSTLARIPTLKVQALPLTAAFSLLVPIPLLLPAAIRATPTWIQIGLALYLTTPALCVLFQTLASKVLERFGSTSRSAWFDQPVKTTYLIVGVASALTHLAVVAYVLFPGRTQHLSLSKLYFPDHTLVQKGREDILVAGALLFFQWDYIIINLTLLCHGFYFLQQRFPVNQKRATGNKGQLFTMVILTFILGPGAGLVFALCLQEDDGYIASRESSRPQRPYGTN